MKRVIIHDYTPIPPFGEPARELRILNKPLWLIHTDLLKKHCRGKLEFDSFDDLPEAAEDEYLVYRDNLFFNAELIDEFVLRARAKAVPCQVAFRADDPAILAHTINLQEGVRLTEDERYYVADLYYYPPGPRYEAKPLVIETEAHEMGFYHIPHYMVPHGDLVFQVPVRALLSIENWVHVLLANIPMGVFAWARQAEAVMEQGRLRNMRNWTGEDWTAFREKLGVVGTSFIEKVNPFEEPWRNHFLASKKLVKVGKNCSIDPTAVIHGPTVIGDNVYIGPGTVITNSIIGNNANIMQGAQVMLSVVSDGCFLPFNAALFMSSLMENSMVAQNSTLQLTVVGRNTFIGANNTFTDFDLLGRPISTFHKGELKPIGLPVIGSAVGHNCKIGSGFTVYPARMIGSNTILINDHDETLVRKNVPGLDPHDTDAKGNPRHIIYRWPRQFLPGEDLRSAPGRPPVSHANDAPTEYHEEQRTKKR